MGSLSSLEVVLRIAVYTMETPAAERFPREWRMTSLTEGDRLPKSWLTDWRGLGAVIDAYNEHECGRGGQALVDVGIKDLRDAFAHGRILAETLDSPLVLVRFSDIVDGFATVIGRQELTLEWIRDQTRRVNNALSRAHARRQQLAAA
jgi:hypothetical protein